MSDGVKEAALVLALLGIVCFVGGFGAGYDIGREAVEPAPETPCPEPGEYHMFDSKWSPALKLLQQKDTLYVRAPVEVEPGFHLFSTVILTQKGDLIEMVLEER